MKLVLVHNNQGIRHLNERKPNLAIPCFVRAMASMEELLTDVDAQVGNSIENLKHAVEATEVPGFRDGASFYTFNQTFHLGASVLLNEGAAASYVSVVVMFNLALAFHQAALINPNKAHRVGQRALRFYSHCLQAQEGLLEDRSPLGPWLRVAAVANMAQVCLHLCAEKEAAMALLEALQSDLAAGILDEGSNLISDEHMTQIKTGILLARSLVDMHAAVA